jgi:hypothetical protein
MIIDSPNLSGSVTISGSVNIQLPSTGSNIPDTNTVIALSIAYAG